MLSGLAILLLVLTLAIRLEEYRLVEFQTRFRDEAGYRQVWENKPLQ